MDELSCLVTKRGGKLEYENREYLARQLARIPDGTRLEWILREPRNTRSARANRYYWKLLTIIADDTGNDKEDLHEFFKAEFLEPKLIRLTDDEGGVIERKIRPSTTRLTSKEFTVYVGQIKAFAFNRLNIVLPEPEDLAA